MTTYPYTLSGPIIDLAAFQTTINGLGLAQTVSYCNGGPAVVQIVFPADLSPADLTTLNNFMATYTPPGPRVLRPLYLIAVDFFALTSAQKTNVVTDLFTGNLATGGQKWQRTPAPQIYGVTGGSIGATAASGAPVFNQGQQLQIAALYAQAFPSYYVHPNFDSTINIPGDQPA